MLEKVNLLKTIVKSENKQEIDSLKEQLMVLQQQVKLQKLPVIVLLEGWAAAGKGNAISQVLLALDPRGVKVHAAAAVGESEDRKPILFKYWHKTPMEGQIVIFDEGWYQELLLDQAAEKVDNEGFYQRLDSINTFERQLADEGCLVVKCFLHINQKEQKARFEKLEESKNTFWRISEDDRRQNKKYERYYKNFDGMLEYTNTTDAPWHLIGANDKSTAVLEILQGLVQELTSALTPKNTQGNALAPAGDPIDLTKLDLAQIKKPVYSNNLVLPISFPLIEMPKLATVNLEKTIDEESYDEQLKKEQKKLSMLHNKIYLAKIPVIAVFEGWDASGKGGAIRRTAAALDPRGYEVIPIAAPDRTELAHHYLWRFWSQLPKTGHIGIFDRSWYGRVMVERIEGFCTEAQWRRAYQEINEFELELHNWGAVVVKYWLQVDQQEQLRRFTDRQNTPEKQWKITDEDWRNRSKWPQYEEAVDDMLKFTATEYAPWQIVESNDKKFARLKVIKTLVNAIESGLQNLKN